jgi:DNA polymerase-3 subunit alpha
MQQRLDYELEVIEQAGFSQYILIVADLVQQAKKMDILCAPRGSSAGSLVCFAAGIAPLNPLDYGLLFERFLNPDRIAPPDIDLDIADEARPRLLDYVVSHYGASNVAHIATHSLEGAKSALRDAAKALGSDGQLASRLVALIPMEFQRPWTLARTIAEEPETMRLYKNDAAAHTLLDAALSIEGTGRNSGTHAAGVVITPRSVAEYGPLLRTQGLGQEYHKRVIKNEDGSTSLSSENYQVPTTMTQWDMNGVEKRGLLKMDLLGLTAWSAIGHTLDFIKARSGQSLDVWQLPTDDANTYRSIAQGYTSGVFQLEKQGMTGFAMNMKPQSIADLAFLIAAYRPGPMPFLGQIMAVHNGSQMLKAPHPLVAPLLAETYGAPVYQETMLKLAREVAGYSLGEADALRKAIGKKNERELVAQQARFMEGASVRGLTETQAAEIWEMFPPFAFYGFNQAHAIVYGYLTYITAYLKVNYPLEYLGALLIVAGNDTEAVAKAAAECRRLQVSLLGPDINHSAARLILDQLPDGTTALRLGLGIVKGLGPTGLEAIMAARQSGGLFTGLADFIKRVPGRAVNARTLTSLAKVGAFPFGNRAQMEALIATAQKAAKAKTLVEPDLPSSEEYPLTQLLEAEYQLLGIHLTAIPINETVERLHTTGRINSFTNQISEDESEGLPKPKSERKTIRVGGALTGGHEVKSMYGQMFSFDLNDGRGLLEVAIFPKVYKQYPDLLKEGQLLVVEGQLQFNEGRPRLTAAKIELA